ncbi:hypothetical protein L484_013049 [Morus notabilis]|uniref:Uncharacterized protein n=1 Tax=Morus notabilis TaxID=981085 RepID=W9SA89_9ROSA|nr:hypothetical protein L484_013049 [Morus notabilis]
MASKITIPALLIATLVVAAAIVETGEALSECAKQCMPVCLKEQGATIPVCETACENYCQQSSDNGGQGGGGVV